MVNPIYVYITSHYTNPVTKQDLGSGVTLDKCGDRIIGIEVLDFHRLEVRGKDILTVRDTLFQALERIASDSCMFDDIMGIPCPDTGRGKWCGVCIANDTLAKLRG